MVPIPIPKTTTGNCFVYIKLMTFHRIKKLTSDQMLSNAAVRTINPGHYGMVTLRFVHPPHANYGIPYQGPPIIAKHIVPIPR